MGGEPRAGRRLHVLRGRLISTGMCQTENGAGNSAVPVHLRVEPAHFDWRWRKRPALARCVNYFLSAANSGKIQCLSAISTTLAGSTFSHLIVAAFTFENFTMTARSTVS